MTLPVVVVNGGEGPPNPMKINGEGEVGIVIHSHPPIDEKVEAYPFRQYLTDDGTSSGSNDMIVDGSSTSLDFCIAASDEKDLWVKMLSFRIGDTGTVNLSTFGALSALSTGCELLFKNNDLGEVTIADAITTNLELIRLGIATGAVGTGNDAYLLDVQGGGSEDTYLPAIDLSQTFGFPWGLRLKKGSKDKLIFRINDALAGLITFNAIGYGIQLNG